MTLPLASLLTLLATITAAWLWLGPSRSLPRPSRPSRSWSSPRSLSIASVGLALIVVVCVPTAGGLVLAVMTGLICRLGLGRLESTADRDRRDRLLHSAPTAADLLASAHSAGLPPARAVGLVAQALPSPGAQLLEVVGRRLAWGEDPDRAWRDVLAEPAWAGLARAHIRSAQTGAAVVPALTAYASDARAARRARQEAAVRSASVLAVVPLGLCFLPAFVLLAVFPLVASLGESLLT